MGLCLYMLGTQSFASFYTLPKICLKKSLDIFGIPNVESLAFVGTFNLKNDRLCIDKFNLFCQHFYFVSRKEGFSIFERFGSDL